MRSAVIVSTARTPIGRAYRGAFNDTNAQSLGGHAVRAAVDRAGLDPAEVEDVIMGAALQQGCQGSNVGRQVALAAGLPDSVPGMSLDRQCSSGLMAIATAAKQVMHDGMQVAVGGGLESVSLVQNDKANWYRLADPGLKVIPKKAQAERLVGVVRERFDFREMSKRVLGQQWRKLDAQEQTRFEELFTDLLQYAYVGRIEEYSGQKVEFVQQRIRANRAEVQTLLVDKDKSIPVSYIMLLQGQDWMAYDIVVEGVSLVRNYMEQFSEILRKEGYPGLVKQIEEKIVQFEQETKRS